jgi:hypothetical protein
VTPKNNERKAFRLDSAWVAKRIKILKALHQSALEKGLEGVSKRINSHLDKYRYDDLWEELKRLKFRGSVLVIGITFMGMNNGHLGSQCLKSDSNI